MQFGSAECSFDQRCFSWFVEEEIPQIEILLTEKIKLKFKKYIIIFSEFTNGTQIIFNWRNM